MWEGWSRAIAGPASLSFFLEVQDCLPWQLCWQSYLYASVLHPACSPGSEPSVKLRESWAFSPSFVLPSLAIRDTFVSSVTNASQKELKGSQITFRHSFRGDSPELSGPMHLGRTSRWWGHADAAGPLVAVRKWTGRDWRPGVTLKGMLWEPTFFGEAPPCKVSTNPQNSAGN